MPKEQSASEELFWQCADELSAIEGLAEGTIFGFRCLRVDGEFVAVPANDSLWLKLTEARVDELIADGAGEPCRPNGRRFKAWLQVRHLDKGLWLDLIEESAEIVRPD